jgi:hypothetical protein
MPPFNVNMRSPVAVLAVLLMMSGCEERTPLTQALAVGIADHYQRYQNVNWGDPTEVIAPVQVDDEGKRWWQMRYRNGSDGSRRMILVDDASGWARFPSQDYVERVPARSRPDAEHPLQVVEGTCILRLIPAKPADAQRRVELEREVIRLNALAGRTGLAPLFSLRTHTDGQTGIIFGWQADRGITRDDQVLDWVKRRTGYGEDATWEELVPR